MPHFINSEIANSLERGRPQQATLLPFLRPNPPIKEKAQVVIDEPKKLIQEATELKEIFKKRKGPSTKKLRDLLRDFIEENQIDDSEELFS